MKKFTSSFLMLSFLLLFGSNLSAQTPFWTEDFDSQLPADWTAIKVAGDNTPSSNWVWTNTGPAGGFSTGALLSTTATNGWMLFDSDLNCSGNQDVRLVSPKVNCTGRDVVILEFETHYRRFNDKTFVRVSVDSVNWTEIEIFAGFTNNMFGSGTTVPGDAINPFKVTVDLTATAANQPQVWIAFRFLADPSTIIAGTDVGCAYSWQIDDVALYDIDNTPAINLAIGDFFYPPASYAQPVTQIKTDTMGFFADLSNLGSAAVTNVVLKAEVRQGTNTIWSDSLLIPEVAIGVTDSTYTLPNVFIPNALTVGNNYSIRYRVYSLDGVDADMANNTKQEAFIVTDVLYSKEAGATTAYRPGGTPADWAVGNVYQTGKNWVEQYKATKATIRVIKNADDGPLAGSAVAIALVEIKDNLVDANWNGFEAGQPYTNNPTMGLRSFNLYDFTATGGDATVAIDLYDIDSDLLGVTLAPGKRYILIAEYQGPANITIFHAFSEEISYFQISTVVYTGTWFLGGFGPAPAAVLRMDIDLFSTADEVSLPDNSLSFYPNPANANLNVDISLEEPTLANITLADLNGRVILIDEVENAYQQKRQYDVSNLPNGMYIVRIATKQGTKTKKFVVQH